MNTNAKTDSLVIPVCIVCVAVAGRTMSVNKNINQSTNKRARNERLNYVTNYYSNSWKAAILGTVRSAVYRSSLRGRLID
eukprot:scaffold27061_cov152-Skeletonema_menzelii.AAC.4